MTNPLNPPAFPNISLSHFELFVKDVSAMQAFYTQSLGFVVTDRGEGENAMVFLSRNPNEHHQLVLSPRNTDVKNESPIDHIAFRVDSIASLRMFYQLLLSHSLELQSISHGTAWSIYFRDPENNRLELFTDTPWHVNQPCRFEIDLSMSDEELHRFTENKIKNLPGFVDVRAWRKSHGETINDKKAD